MAEMKTDQIEQMERPCLALILRLTSLNQLRETRIRSSGLYDFINYYGQDMARDVERILNKSDSISNEIDILKSELTTVPKRSLDAIAADITMIDSEVEKLKQRRRTQLVMNLNGNTWFTGYRTWIESNNVSDKDIQDLETMRAMLKKEQTLVENFHIQALK